MRTPYFFRNPAWFRLLFGGVMWSAKTTEKVIYLTFDDGPHPEVTPYVLDVLSEYQAKATFFCVGEHLKLYPDVIKRIERDAHYIGNHTYSHLNGWNTTTSAYCDDVNLFEKIRPSKLFRPPYGRITPAQKRAIKHKIILWSYLSGDFDQSLDIEKSLRNLKKASCGDIMLFHDSEKAFGNLKVLLPVVLGHFSKLGFSFKSLKAYAID